jgi:hypothetical protein
MMETNSIQILFRKTQINAYLKIDDHNEKKFY